MSKFSICLKIAGIKLGVNYNRINAHIGEKYGVCFWENGNNSNNWSPNKDVTKCLIKDTGFRKHTFIPSRDRWDKRPQRR